MTRTTALSPHFSLEEFITSQYAERNGIDNTPPEHIVERLRNTATNLEIVRGLLGQPLIITSGYRSQKLNTALNGAAHSAHRNGDAVDFICPAYGSPLKICKAIHAAQIQFDQLINEGAHKDTGGWVHISFSIPMRQEILTARFTATGVEYTGGLA